MARPRFVLEDDNDRINIVSVIDTVLKLPAWLHVSKQQGEILAALLNSQKSIPEDRLEYENLVRKLDRQAGYLGQAYRAFDDGFRNGMILGNEADENARIYRVNSHCEAYKQGVLFAQRILNGEIAVM